MTIWLPDLAAYQGPRYRAIADALRDDIDAGRLTAGSRLPTHRELAWKLGVTVGTVSRAYAEAERRGLIGGEVGRGTFVRDRKMPTTRSIGRLPGMARDTAPDDPPHFSFAGGFAQVPLIDLGRNYMPLGEAPALLAETMREIAAGADLKALLSYHDPAGWIGHREAGARWLGASGVDATPERIVVTCGGHHGVSLALAALARPGDTVAAEGLTYTGLLAICRQRGIALEPIDYDAEGILPDALAAACRRGRIRFLYLVPNLQNPVGGVLSSHRRRAIVETARRHDIIIIEDDIFGFLIDPPSPAFANLAPERTLHIGSLSKSLAPGLRIGWLLAPEPMVQRVIDAIHADVWMAAPMMAEIASRWINDGTAARLVQDKRDRAPRHQALARQALGNAVTMHPRAYHIWLPLPEARRAADVVAEAQRQGVAILSGEAFNAGPGPAANGIRICLGAAADLTTLARGLNILAGILREDAAPARLMVV